MKNLNSFDEDCFSVFKDAVGNKRNLAQKSILMGLESRVESQFSIYSGKFTEKKIYEVSSVISDFDEKEVLIDLYSYKSAIIKKIKNKILDSQVRNINATCQYCTLNSVNSLDHFIPKEDFPEFSVNPLNLFPCCSECNSKKSNLCFKGDESLFLNLYLDELPCEEYLKATFDFSNDIPLVTFFLENSGVVDSVIYRTIFNHYNRLNLLERMRERSNDTITDIISTIKVHYKLNPNVDLIKKIIMQEEGENKKAYGFNYWKSVLKLSLIQYDDFWEKFIL